MLFNLLYILNNPASCKIIDVDMVPGKIIPLNLVDKVISVPIFSKSKYVIFFI